MSPLWYVVIAGALCALVLVWACCRVAAESDRQRAEHCDRSDRTGELRDGRRWL